MEKKIVCQITLSVVLTTQYYQEIRTFTESDQLLAKKNRRVSYGVSTSISVSDEDPSLDESSTSAAKPPLTCRQWQASIFFKRQLLKLNFLRS